MFGIGMPELLLILAVALIVIGPKKLPDLAKSLGRAMGEFKRATNDLKQSIEQETGLDEVRQSMSEVNRDIRRSIDPIDLSPTADAAQETPSDEEVYASEADESSGSEGGVGDEPQETPGSDMPAETKEDRAP
jgi:Tat protein translocase TatB subunit